MKICGKCRVEKSLEEFNKNSSRRDGYTCYCKVCLKLLHKIFYKSNKQKYKDYYNDNKERLYAQKILYRTLNKDKVRAGQRKYYYQNKLACRKRCTKRELTRRNEDPLFKFIKKIRGIIRVAFIRRNFKKNNATQYILGCSFDRFRTHLIDTAIINYGIYNKDILYHIDHIIPLSSAKTQYDVLKLNHYTNLQLLTAEDNMKKSNNINWKNEKAEEL